MAIEDFFEPVRVQDWRSAPDGFGGVRWDWHDGAEINAGFIMSQSMEARVAEAQGIKSIYTLVLRTNSGLENKDVVRRMRDGSLYRVTSDFDVSPDMMDEPIMTASAEKVVVP